MPQSFGEPLTKLRAVPIEDNGEPLIDPCGLSRRIVFAVDHPRFAGMKRVPDVRESVARMLARAADLLPRGLTLQIIEGYRPLAQQRFMYAEIRADFARRHPEWNAITLSRATNAMSAPPDDRCPPPHSTGAAVDLCLVNTVTGDVLDMTSPLAWDETSAPMNIAGLSDIARKNRRILMDALTPTGLTNYAGEWWHWSYGDSGWALRTGTPRAMYGRMEE